MKILVSKAQLTGFGKLFLSEAPDTELLTVDVDGTVRSGDRVLTGDDSWGAGVYLSSDLFDDDGAAEMGQIFRWAMKNEALEWLHIAAAGVDNPIFGVLLERGVRISTSHHTGIPIAEYVLAQVLRTRIPMESMAADQAAHRWGKIYEWDEIHRSKWLVIGMGGIGAEVAVRARAFGAHVTGVRRNPNGDEPVDAIVGLDEVASLLPGIDVVVLAVPATSTTIGLADAEFFACMKPGSTFVNVGRGALVDEDALRVALDGGIPQVAILDVASEEPLPAEHWLWGHPSVVLTAHTSAGGRQRHERASQIFAANLGRYSRGEPLADEVSLADR